MTDRSQLRGIVKRATREMRCGTEARAESASRLIRNRGGVHTTPRRWMDTTLEAMRRIHGEGLVYVARTGPRRNPTAWLFHLEPLGGETRRWAVGCTTLNHREGIREYRTRIEIGEHALERIFQRTGTYTPAIVAHELMAPIMTLAECSPPRERTEEWLPAPHGLALVGSEAVGTGESRYVVVTFIATYQLTDEQRGLWHYRRGQLREEYSNLLPEAPLEIPGTAH